MYIEAKACWLNHLDNAMEKYNHVHGTTKMTPFEASNDEPILKVICISSLIPSNNNDKLPKFQVGDYVRVPDKSDIYSKERLYNNLE